jgi:lysophospholipase L1-like esterase
MRLTPVSVVLVVLCAAASSFCGDEGDSPTSPSPGGSGNTVAYTVLAASDGLGVGGSIVCAPFDLACENGTGYAQRIRRRFQSDGRTVSFLNLSVPGTVLSPAIAALARQVGRDDPGNFLDQYPAFVPTTTTHVTIFTGGNDANVIATAATAGLGGNDTLRYVDGLIRQWGVDLGELVTRVRARAPNARIVAFNLPNLAAAPYLTSRSTVERSVMQRISTGLTDQINALTNRNVLVIDLMCDPRILVPGSFSGDGFHPSDVGYAVMAELAYPALTNGTAALPSPTCALRTVLPVL